MTTLDYERSHAGYDPAHENELAGAILNVIAEKSVIVLDDGQRILHWRTNEAANALLSALALNLSLSPESVRSPTAIRHLCDDLAKHLRRKVAAARASTVITDFERRMFRSDDSDRGGHA